MSDPRYIGVFDSGVGGLSVWREIARQFPHERTLYLADQARVPYGSRQLAEVRELSGGITRFLLDQGAKIIVVACNTASAAALHHLRRTFPDVPFVGMEPAVKPAVERTHNGVVGVIATQATFQGALFASLVARYAEYLAPLIERGADQLVLGCTHYPFLRPAIERVVGTNVAVIDPAPAIARQTGRVLAQWGLKADPAGGHHVFYTSGDAAAFATMVRRLVPCVGEGVRVRAARWREGDLRAPA